jgi:hypothetical protein
MKTHLLAILATTATPVTAAAPVTFTPSTQDIPNPERGFYRAAWTTLDKLEPWFLEDTFRQGTRLVYARIDLEDFRERAIPRAYLARLKRGFAATRRAGLKLIIRATYNYPQGETEYHNAKDATLARVRAHLEQLQPLLAENADVIAFVQAGFIGAWGEWHTSSNNLTTDRNRAQVRDALMAAVPAGRFIQFRYPPDLIGWTPTLPPLDAALSGAFRIGFHNDCFVASQTDVGTFPEEPGPRREMRRKIAAQTALAPFGGETCNPADDPGAKPRTDCADIRREGADFHLTYLNADYYRPLFHERWTQQGCMDEVRHRMGYRLVLDQASARPAAAPGETWRLGLAIRNAGWARPYNARPLEVLLINRRGVARRLAAVGADARSWLPGETSSVTAGVAIPAGLPAGTYQVALALPDASASLHDDARYALRLANADDAARGQQWDAALGAFRLGMQLRVR